MNAIEEAQIAYQGALAIEPDIACHHRLPGVQQPFVGMDRAEALLERAIELDSSLATAHAALGNIFVRRFEMTAAMRAYGAAVLLDWNFADAHFGLAALFELARDDANAERHYREAVGRKQLYVVPDQCAAQRILVLKAPGKAVHNTPLDFVVNHARTALQVLYVMQDKVPQKLPDYDLIYCGMDEAEASEAYAERSMHFIASQAKPVLNHPRHLQKTRRHRLRETLASVPGCTVPPTLRVARQNVQRVIDSLDSVEMQFPLLIRPVDTNRGDGLVRLSTPQDAEAYLAGFSDDYFNISPFIDYRSADGLYRKYRVIVVDGRPYAYHLAISDHWMVHYVNSRMDEYAWMREEEERFLRNPESIFPAWEQTFGMMANAIGLEYFGVDCTRNPDGSVLVFEAGAAMLVHCLDSPEIYPYKYDHVPRIFDAVERLFERAR